MKMRIEGLLIALLFFSGCAGLQVDRNGSSAVESEVLAKSTSSWDGNLLPGYPEGQPEITIIRIKIPPGASLPMHKHPVINTGVLVKGSLTVETKDGKKLYLNEGDTIVEVVDTWHYGRNEGEVPAEIIVFYAGKKSFPVTVYGEDH